MERILVGVDGSQAALDALAWATDLARRGGLELIAARAVAPTRAERSPDRDVSLPEDATPTDTVLLDGDPPDALLAAAHDRHAGLLVVGSRGAGGFDQDIHPVAAIIRALDAHPGSVAVVGTRGLGGFTGLRLGRVPLQLVHRTGAAVIVVPPAGRA